MSNHQTTKTDEFTCPSSNSIWDFVKSVNNDVLGKIQVIVRENPGCSQIVKCELAYYVPHKLKKFFPGLMPRSEECSSEYTKCPLM